MSPPGPILVVNPNSSAAVTAGLDRAVEPFRIPGGPAIECLDIPESPPGIVTQADVDAAAPRVAAIAAVRRDATALVIACYSQPGLDAARAATPVPVYGIQECGVLAALTLAERFGVIAVAEAAVPRHLAFLDRIGVSGRLAGELAAEGLTVAGSGHGEASFRSLLRTGMRLRDLGAGVIVLGCAGMSDQRAPLESALGVAVIDPTQAAAAFALGRILGAGL